jgi:dTDP-4-amino-4,6-dideoxygalactose transaminase
LSNSLAIHGGTPVRSEPWPRWPEFGDPEEKALLEALRSGTWGIGGALVPELECRYAGLHEARFAVACSNGTVALEIALIAAGVQPGDEVITSPYTFMATALACLTVGAVPVFADVEPGTHNIDPASVERAISDRTTAIMPVHIGGRPCDMNRLGDVAARRGLRIVEDAAQAWTAAWCGKPVGALGTCGTFSFQSSKNLTAGEGGIVLTNDEEVFGRAWSYHNCGRTPGGAWYEHAQPGLNHRMGELQAALLLAGLDRLPVQQERRRAALRALESKLVGLEGLEIPEADDRVTAHACHFLPLRLDPELLRATRDEVVEALRAEGIPAHPGYTAPLYRQKFLDWFAERPTGSGALWRDVYRLQFADYHLPVCERLCETTIWIKQDVLLAGPGEMGDVAAAIEKVLGAARHSGLRARSGA